MMTTPITHEIDLDAEAQEARYAAAVASLDAGDVLATVDDMIASLSDPHAHPCYRLVAYYLSHGGTDTGTRPHHLSLVADQLDALVRQAIDRLIEARME